MTVERLNAAADVIGDHIRDGRTILTVADLVEGMQHWAGYLIATPSEASKSCKRNMVHLLDRVESANPGYTIEWGRGVIAIKKVVG